MNAVQTPIDELVDVQKAYFTSGATRSASFRRERLAALRDVIQKNETAIIAALQADLRKNEFESYTSEIGFVYEEIRLARRRLRRWMRPRRAATPIVHFPARSRIITRPYGVTAIFAPWNYPFQLALVPLVSAIAAGNCAILKPSEFARESSALLTAIVGEAFNPEHVAVLEGDADLAARLGAALVDHIFYTGSSHVGKAVMRTAAEKLTPVTLELGGKSPAVVVDDAHIDQAARRIAWGAYLNAGQTCVSPDFVAVQASVVDLFCSALGVAVREMFGEQPMYSGDYGRMIDSRHFDRLAQLAQRETESGATLLFGGDSDPETRYIAPTAFCGSEWDGPLMEEEIFGPILPIVTFASFDELVDRLNRLPRPLAAYMFTSDSRLVRRFQQEIAFGGATINDTIIQIANPAIPFGGIGASGTGSYHGYAGYKAFSHEAGVMFRGTWLDIPLRYPPYGKALRLIRRVMRP